MRLNYAWQNFHKAFRCINSRGTSAQNLKFALGELHTLTPTDLPEDLQESFKEIWKQMTSVQSQGEEGKITATVNSLSDAEVQAAIDKILSMHERICQLTGNPR
jgi:hypothetical protein